MQIVLARDLEYVPAGHENPVSPGVWKKILLRRDDLQAGRIQMVNWARMPVGRGFAPHYHEDLQELFVIIRGEAEIMSGAEAAVLHPGDAVVIEPREVHEMRNRSDEDVEYLAVGITSSSGGKTIVVAPAAR